MINVACPDDADLLQLAMEGDAELASCVRSHAADCDKCRVRLDQLRRAASALSSVSAACDFKWRNGPQANDFPYELGECTVLGPLAPPGGQAQVLRAFHRGLQKEVAIKVSHRPVADRERLLTEARTLADLDHPGLVRVHTVAIDEECPYIIMELVKGVDLGQVSRNVSSEDAARWIGQLAETVDVIHRHGVLHLDLKPRNIIIDDKRQTRLIDFGLVELRNLWSKNSESQQGIRGTPPYMAPEQVSGILKEIGCWTDVWALGVVLYELLTRTLPFTGATTDELFEAIQHADPPLPRQITSSIDADMERIVLKCLAKEPGRRYGSAGELAGELNDWLARSSGSRNQYGFPRRLMVLGGSAIAAAALVAVFARPYLNSTQPAPVQLNSTPVQAPLQVAAIEVRHFERTQEGGVSLGVIGQQTFTPRKGDQVQICAKLSEPAYCYLIAFHADGTSELCFPESDTESPPRTDTPQYPVADRDQATVAYGLKEGTGLWAFAVVASGQPLPGYREWLARHFNGKPPWQRNSEVFADIAWWDDGLTQLHHLTPDLPTFKPRGKGEELLGPARTIQHLTDTLRSQGKAETASVFGFCVAPGRTASD